MVTFKLFWVMVFLSTGENYERIKFPTEQDCIRASHAALGPRWTEVECREFRFYQGLKDA